jgi:hypothetical protein
MANLNLSQFTEKTFVADADHTFIWDTVGAISKRVSRNSWLNSGTLTSDAPVTISQTWNNAAVAFTGLKVNATSTNSAAASLLLDLQVGGVSQASFNKDGRLLIVTQGAASTPSILIGSGAGFYQPTNTQISFSSNTLEAIRFTNAGIRLGLNELGFGSAFNVSPDTILLRDSANTLALRNGANAQTFNVYGTYTSGASYARLAIACDTSGNATLTTQSTGVAGTVSINGVPVGLGKGNVSSNVAVGTGALNANTTGSHNSVLGFQVFQNNTSGSYNVATGWQALYANTTGSVNSAFGAGALTSNTTGQYNSAIGVNALQNNTTGGYNAASGPQALQNNTTGGYNAAIGYNAGTYLTNGSSANATGTNSLFLGTETKAAAAGETNQIVIGYQAIGIGSNSVVLGNDSITKTALKGNVGIGTTAPGAKLQVSYANQVLTGNITDLDVSAKHHIAAYTPDTAGINVGASLGLGGCYFNNANYITFGAIAGRKELATNNNAQGYLSFLTASNGSGLIERMRIDSVGNVGIGTTSPTSKLHVNGAIIQKPDTSATPATNGDLVVEATSNTLLTFKLKGTDGTVRTGTIALV